MHMSFQTEKLLSPAKVCQCRPELIEGNGYEGRQTSKGELFVKVFGMSRDCEGAHIDFKMVASV